MWLCNSNMPQASIKHYFLPCRILHVNVQEMCKKKREFLQCRYNTYTHMYKLSVRLSIKPSRLIYKHGVQVVISQCVCSSSFLNQQEVDFSQWGSWGPGLIRLCVFVGHLVHVGQFSSNGQGGWFFFFVSFFPSFSLV